VLDGHYPPYDGADALYSPRRTVLDALLVDTDGTPSRGPCSISPPG
jgi:hypothetical protein